MREMIHDPFYELIRTQYPRCVIDYVLLKNDTVYQGAGSHDRAVLYAMLKVIERYLDEHREIEETYGTGHLFPWSFDFGKAKAVRISTSSFLYEPKIIRRDRNGTVFYDMKDPDTGKGEQIPYWYAFLEPPHTSGYTPEDFHKVNTVLFPEGTEGLEVYEWSTDWSSCFDDGHEWWGTACWSVYDPAPDRFIVLFASATD